MLIFLFMSYALFLWTYFAAESIEQMAIAGRIKAPEGLNVQLLSGQFAAKWRHGMTGNSPIYMSGFFLVGALTWLLAINQPLRRLAFEGIAAVTLAMVLAHFLAPLGAVEATEAFEDSLGFRCEGQLLGHTFHGAAVALYTLFTWTAGMVASQRAVARRSIRPFWVPLVLNIILASIRPWTVNDFTTLWIQRVLQGNPMAILSLVAVPALGTFLILYQIRQEASNRNKERSGAD